MKTLLLMRHAKSSWDDSRLSDFERPLNERGLSTAPYMGSVMAENNLSPDRILSSPAERAKQTAFLVKDGGNLPAVVELDENIYEASPFRLLEIVNDTPASVDTLMLVGHNPGMEGLLKILTGETHSIPTAALIKIPLNVSNWSGVHNESGSVEMFFRPRELMKNNDV